MALVIGGATLSGKLGNKVYAKTGWARAYAIPTNPNTTPQAAIRAMIAGYSTVFRSFTPAEQEAWKIGAENFPRYNRIGEKYELAGMNFYTSCAMLAQLTQNAGYPVAIPGASDVPVPQTVASPSITMLESNGSEVVLHLSGDLGADEYWMIFLTAPLSTGVNFTRRSRYRLVRIIDKVAVVSNRVDLTTEYTAIFGGVPPAGTKVFVECWGMEENEWVKRSTGKAFTIAT